MRCRARCITTTATTSTTILYSTHFGERALEVQGMLYNNNSNNNNINNNTVQHTNDNNINNNTVQHRLW